jgi:hypothetical protein
MPVRGSGAVEIGPLHCITELRETVGKFSRFEKGRSFNLRDNRNWIDGYRVSLEIEAEINPYRLDGNIGATGADQPGAVRKWSSKNRSHRT